MPNASGLVCVVQIGGEYFVARRAADLQLFCIRSGV